MRNILVSIIRHGQTDYNLRGVLQGQMETSLNATGREEAEKLGVKLRDEVYTHAHSSNMERAADTARIVLRNNRVPATDKGKNELQLDARLRERSFGIFEGKPKEELAEFHRQAARDKNYPGKRHFTPPDGESCAAVYARARECLMDILMNTLTSLTTNGTRTTSTDNVEKSVPDASVLIFTHGGVAIELFAFFVKELHCQPPAGMNSSQMIAIPGNTALSTFRLTIDDDGIKKKELSHVLTRPNELITQCVCLNIHDRTHCRDAIINGGKPAV